MSSERGLLVGGRWKPGSAVTEVIDPAKGEAMGNTAVASPDAPPEVPPPPPPPMYAVRCGRCGAMFSGPWCPVCGTPAGVSPGAGARAAGSVVWTLSMIAFLILLTANLAALAYVSWIMLHGGGPYPIALYLLAPFPVGEEVRTDAAAFFLYFSLIVFGILAAYAWYGVRDAKPTAEAFSRPLDQLRARLESKSAWIVTGQVFLAALFFQIAYILVLAGIGFEPTEPQGSGGLYPFWYDYYALANASVYEEIVTRFLFIGVPLAAGAAILGARVAKSGSPRTPAWWHLLGGTLNRDSSPALVALAAGLVGVSSVVFGLGHVPAWGWWKFLPTMVAGLGMGYLFVRRGLLAAVLFHFATDYMAALLLLTANPGDPTMEAVQILLALFIFVLVGLGLFFFVWYLRYTQELWRHLMISWGLRAPAPAAAPAPPFAAWNAPPLSGPFAPPPMAPPSALKFTPGTASIMRRRAASAPCRRSSNSTSAIFSSARRYSSGSLRRSGGCVRRWSRAGR